MRAHHENEQKWMERGKTWMTKLWMVLVSHPIGFWVFDWLWYNQNQSNLNGQSNEKKIPCKRQWEVRVITTKLPKARENAGDLVVYGFSFASDWLRAGCEILWSYHSAKWCKTNVITGYFRHPNKDWSEGWIESSKPITKRSKAS